jgi:ABC-type nitrate/sulfonate/bicarbonate transport system, ATPase component
LSNSEAIILENLYLEYPGLKVLENVNLKIRDGEVIAVIGPSGCGKTTMAHLILGLIPPNVSIRGRIMVYGIDVLSNVGVKTLYREIGVGYVSQVDTLLPWRTLIDNLMLPLQIRGIPRREALEMAKSLLELVSLNGFEKFYPHQLSGGMRQRAQLARALITSPKLLVMDEPFGALDALTRINLQGHLSQLISKLGSTVIFITHDIEEAITIGTRIIVMSRRPGTIKASIAVEEPHPRDPFKVRASKYSQDLKEKLLEILSGELTAYGED